MKLKEWIAIWQEKYDAPSVRKTTYEAHRYILQNHIVPRLGEYELTELTTEDVEHFLADCKTHGNPRRKEPLSDVTMRHIWTLLAGILNQAVADGVIAENPAKGFLYKQPKQVQATVLMKWEIDAYLNAAEELGYLPIFTLALSYGLRQRGLIALKWSDLDTESRTLTIHEQRVVECGKLVEYEGQTRVLQLS